ncbi:unnamed protein product [Ixodes persulcatus]
MVKDVVKKRRSGMKVAGTVVRALCFQPRSNQAASSMLRQRAFLGHLLERLGTQPAQVVEKLKALKAHLIRPENVTVHVSANLEKLSALGDVGGPWRTCLSEQPPAGTATPRRWAGFVHAPAPPGSSATRCCGGTKQACRGT